ncbi:MAG: SPOR domain-containing protein [Bacteroidales bacterium]|nr:SPOR domain-containing protein [Bacteroidales bacterium]
MDRKILAVLALTMALTTGCDWIRAKLDMPTSEDIAKKKELIAQKEAAEKAAAAVADSLVAADSTLQQVSPEPVPSKSEVQKPETASSGLNLTPRSNLDKTYYIIVGAFKTDELVKASFRQHEGILETPFAFSGNGLKYVAIGGYATLEEARAALYQAHQKAPDAWVWKKK